MFKKIVVVLAAAMFLAVAAVELSAQDVLMNSAETIIPGNVKIGVFPTLLFSKNGSGSLAGVAGRAGVGLTSRFDIEAKAAIFKDLTYFGADAEYWIVKNRSANVSAALGAHMTNFKGGLDSSGIDATLMFSTKPVDRLELYSGLRFAFDSFKDSDQNATLAHIVPGIEYRISDDLDFLAEIGIALNDNSRSYVSVGLSLYILR